MSKVREQFEALVREHFEAEPGLRMVRLYSGDDDDVVRLLEVNAEALPTGSIVPLAFQPGADLPLPTLIADVTPDELEQLDRGALSLPPGWRAAGVERTRSDVEDPAAA